MGQQASEADRQDCRRYRSGKFGGSSPAALGSKKGECHNMSESMWHKQGETLSHNNACKEYGLTEKQIIDAIKQGKLQYKQNYAHGNPYFRLLRREVESLAQELLGANGASEQAIKHQLATISKEINSLKRRLTSLEKQRIQLLKKQNNEKA